MHCIISVWLFKNNAVHLYCDFEGEKKYFCEVIPLIFIVISMLSPNSLQESFSQ